VVSFSLTKLGTFVVTLFLKIYIMTPEKDPGKSAGETNPNKTDVNNPKPSTTVNTPQPGAAGSNVPTPGNPAKKDMTTANTITEEKPKK
jgi:hypothetical protein